MAKRRTIKVSRLKGAIITRAEARKAARIPNDKREGHNARQAKRDKG